MNPPEVRDVDRNWVEWMYSPVFPHSVTDLRFVFPCGGDLVTASGLVGSEGFPNIYKPNSKCTWRITVSHWPQHSSKCWPLPLSVLSAWLIHDLSAVQVPEGNVVKLTFRIFDMEADSQCQYDYLDVYNGPSNLVQKLGRFCGTFRPGALISTTNTIMLEMVTDGETQSRGFVAHFSGVKPYAEGRTPIFVVFKVWYSKLPQSKEPKCTLIFPALLWVWSSMLIYRKNILNSIEILYLLFFMCVYDLIQISSVVGKWQSPRVSSRLPTGLTRNTHQELVAPGWLLWSLIWLAARSAQCARALCYKLSRKREVFIQEYFCHPGYPGEVWQVPLGGWPILPVWLCGIF